MLRLLLARGKERNALLVFFNHARNTALERALTQVRYRFSNLGSRPQQVLLHYSSAGLRLHRWADKFLHCAGPVGIYVCYLVYPNTGRVGVGQLWCGAQLECQCNCWARRSEPECKKYTHTRCHDASGSTLLLHIICHDSTLKNKDCTRLCSTLHRSASRRGLKTTTAGSSPLSPCPEMHEGVHQSIRNTWQCETYGNAKHIYKAMRGCPWRAGGEWVPSYC